MNYWNFIEALIEKNGFMVDRKKGTVHPRYDDVIYPVDYGYIENTKSTDNNEIDVFVGTKKGKGVVGVINTIDQMKEDVEIKVLYNCSWKEIRSIISFFNNSRYMRAIYVRR